MEFAVYAGNMRTGKIASRVVEAESTEDLVIQSAVEDVVSEAGDDYAVLKVFKKAENNETEFNKYLGICKKRELIRFSLLTCYLNLNTGEETKSVGIAMAWYSAGDPIEFYSAGKLKERINMSPWFSGSYRRVYEDQ